MSFFLISVCIHVFMMSCTSCVFNKYNANFPEQRSLKARAGTHISPALHNNCTL